MTEKRVYYDQMKNEARAVRSRFTVRTSTIGLAMLRKIYKDEGIRVDLWEPKLRKVRAAFFRVEGASYVLLNAAMKPKEPRLFAMAHELKHHLFDCDEIGVIGCSDVSWLSDDAREIGAEIFAAELIYPEDEFLADASKLGICRARCAARDVVSLKRAIVAPVSYQFLVKRLEWFDYVNRGAFRGVRFQRLEEELFGVPFYKAYRRPARQPSVIDG